MSTPVTIKFCTGLDSHHLPHLQNDRHLDQMSPSTDTELSRAKTEPITEPPVWLLLLVFLYGPPSGHTDRGPWLHGRPVPFLDSPAISASTFSDLTVFTPGLSL